MKIYFLISSIAILICYNNIINGAMACCADDVLQVSNLDQEFKSIIWYETFEVFQEYMPKLKEFKKYFELICLIDSCNKKIEILDMLISYDILDMQVFEEIFLIKANLEKILEERISKKTISRSVSTGSGSVLPGGKVALITLINTYLSQELKNSSDDRVKTLALIIVQKMNKILMPQQVIDFIDKIKSIADPLLLDQNLFLIKQFFKSELESSLKIDTILKKELSLRPSPAYINCNE